MTSSRCRCNSEGCGLRVAAFPLECFLFQLPWFFQQLVTLVFRLIRPVLGVLNSVPSLCCRSVVDSDLSEDKPSEVGSCETPTEVSDSDGVFPMDLSAIPEERFG